MTELHETLHTEERRLYPHSESVGATGTSVLNARDKNVSSKCRVEGPPGSCYGCGKMGHLHKDCLVNPYMPMTMPAWKQKKKKQNNNVKYRVKKVKYHGESDSDANGNAMFTALYGAHTSDLSNDWIIDSGATKHMTPCRSMFFDYVPFRVHETVSLGDGANCEAVGIGRVAVNIMCEGTVKRYVLSDVLHVPKLVNNFFCVTAATLKGHKVTFEAKKCLIHCDAKLVATGHRTKHLWYIDSVKACAKLKATSPLWHQRLGHVNEKTFENCHKAPFDSGSIC